MKKKVFIIISIIIILPIVICSILLLINNPNRFSEEEHLARVAERIEKRRQNETWFDGKKYESFEVYPLYDINEELKFFLIEYEPYGFELVMLRDKVSLFTVCRMYRLGSPVYVNMTWSPYTIDETNSQPYPEPDKRWILDDNGKRIYYNKSPYFVTGNQNERKYLLGAENLICAVKSGNDFINLIDGKVIDISNGEITKKQPDLGLAFYASKNFVL